MEYTVETFENGDRVYRPVLTEEERNRRQKQLEGAAQRFAQSIEANKRRGEKIG